MTAMRWIALALAVAASPAMSQDWPPQVQTLLDGYAAECAGFENGMTTLEDGAVRPLVLNGTEGHVVDTRHMQCSSAASMFCGGTGGCAVGFVLDGHVTERLTKGWQKVGTPPFEVLLLQVHGSLCGGTNLTPCFEAMAWDPGSGSLTTLAPRAE
jgi:hypothetical protein